MRCDGKLEIVISWMLACIVGCAAQSSAPAEELPVPLGPASGSSGTQGSQTASGPSSGPSGDPGTSTLGGSVTSGSESGQSATASEGASCEGGCSAAPNTCYADTGTCVSGVCEYTPKAASTLCNDGDGCTMVDQCDGAGTCIGSDPLPCDRENTEGGSCVDGACGGWTCVAPYEDCDQDWSNGCEIPTGVPNTCNANGLGSANACGTAYCGIEVGPNAINFMEENYRCMTCSNCSTPDTGEVAWCNQNTGGWFVPEAGECPAFYEGATCEP